MSRDEAISALFSLNQPQKQSIYAVVRHKAFDQQANVAERRRWLGLTLAMLNNAERSDRLHEQVDIEREKERISVMYVLGECEEGMGEISVAKITWNQCLEHLDRLRKRILRNQETQEQDSDQVRSWIETWENKIVIRVVALATSQGDEVHAHHLSQRLDRINKSKQQAW